MALRTVKNHLRNFVTLDDSPERIALAFSIGVFISFSPLLGLHTLIGMFIAMSFGLNRMAMLTGTWINNPWTLLPIYSAATYVGQKLAGFHDASLPIFRLHEMWHIRYWLGIAHDWRFLKPLLLGSTVFSFVAGGLAYAITLLWLRHMKSVRERRAQV
jgi:hypothetical protein